ncbi:unnamed protein product [Laminaria digitata]
MSGCPRADYLLSCLPPDAEPHLYGRAGWRSRDHHERVRESRMMKIMRCKRGDRDLPTVFRPVEEALRLRRTRSLAGASATDPPSRPYPPSLPLFCSSFVPSGVTLNGVDKQSAGLSVCNARDIYILPLSHK